MATLPHVMDLFRLDGRSALVTGGSRGLGRVMAEALAEAGASVCITSRSLDSAHGAAAEVSSTTGGRIVGIEGEVTSAEGVSRLVARAAEQFGEPVVDEAQAHAVRIPGLFKQAAVQSRYVAGEFRRRLLQTDLISLLGHVGISLSTRFCPPAVWRRAGGCTAALRF